MAIQTYAKKDTNGNIVNIFTVPDSLIPQLVDPSDPAVMAFLASSAADVANSDNLTKVLKAVLISAAILAGKTPAQAKATFQAVWAQLP